MDDPGSGLPGSASLTKSQAGGRAVQASESDRAPSEGMGLAKEQNGAARGEVTALVLAKGRDVCKRRELVRRGSDWPLKQRGCATDGVVFFLNCSSRNGG